MAVVTLGSPSRIFFDPEMSDALLEAMTGLAADEAVRAIVVTGGAPGYFVRHYSVAALVTIGEKLKKSGQQWSEDAPYTPGSFASAMRLVEEMPKPVIAAISGTARRSPPQAFCSGFTAVSPKHPFFGDQKRCSNILSFALAHPRQSDRRVRAKQCPLAGWAELSMAATYDPVGMRNSMTVALNTLSGQVPRR